MQKLRNTDAKSYKTSIYQWREKKILKYTKHISAPNLPPFLLGWINSLA